jgi:hypothetical protein
MAAAADTIRISWLSEAPEWLAFMSCETWQAEEKAQPECGTLLTLRIMANASRANAVRYGIPEELEVAKNYDNRAAWLEFMDCGAA